MLFSALHPSGGAEQHPFEASGALDVAELDHVLLGYEISSRSRSGH